MCLASFDLQPGDYKTFEDYGFMNGTLTTMRIKAKFRCEKSADIKKVELRLFSDNIFV